MAMRFLFTSIRGSGHVRPLLPYAHSLRARGHEVRVATPLDAAEMLAAEGLDHIVTPRASDEILRDFWASKGEISNDQMVAIAIPELFVGISARYALPKLQAQIEEWRPDFVIRESAEFAAPVAAECAGIPCMTVEVHNGPVECELFRLAAPAMDKLRAEAGLVADEGAALRRLLGFSAFPASFDNAVRPVDSSDRIRVRSAAPQEPDMDALPSWRKRPESPFVYASFGTVADKKSIAVYRAAAEALGGLDVEGLLTTGPHVDPEALGPVPANVSVRQFVPQAEVLGHADVVLCHGGSGTLVGALSAGKPLIVVPLFADQPDNAARVDQLGLGLAVADRETKPIREALGRVLADKTFSRRAAEVMIEMAALPTVEHATELLETVK